MADTTVATPALLITQAGRGLRGAANSDRPSAITAFLRDPSVYSLFAKPVAGKYSLNVVSADACDQGTNSLVLLGGHAGRCR